MLLRIGRWGEARLSGSKVVLGAVEQLAAVRRAAAHLPRDLLIGVLKDLAEDEDRSLLGCEALEQDLPGATHGLVPDGDVEREVVARHEPYRFTKLFERLVARDTGGGQGIEAEACHDLAEVAALELAIRTWAAQDPLARSYQERVDGQRIDYLTRLVEPLVAGPDEALTVARLLYTVLIGSLYLSPPLGRDELRRIYRFLNRRAMGLDAS